MMMQWVDETKNAGLTFTPPLKPCKAISDGCDKIRKTLNSLICVGIHSNGMNHEISANIIETRAAHKDAQRDPLGSHRYLFVKPI